MLLFILLVTSSLANALLGIGSEQSVSVHGRLLCNGNPASDIKVKLYDVNTFTKDNFLDEEFTDDLGYFTLSGNEKDITTMDPKVNIYHKCNYDGMCYQKVAINIPPSYITNHAIPEKVFDAGEIELAGTFSGQTVDCFN